MFPRRFPAGHAALLGALCAVIGCSRDSTTSTEPAPFPTGAGVFADGFDTGVEWQAFGGSKLDAMSIDLTTHYRGTASLKVVVPAAGNLTGTYAGGAFVANVARNLTTYNALTFWAKASSSIKMDVGGIGNDNTGTSKFTAQWSQIPLTTTWTKYTIPIPDAAKLTTERGLFYFAEGPEGGNGSTIWFDDIQFETLSTISNPRPAIATASISDEVGATIKPAGTVVTMSVGGTDQVIEAFPSYFTFSSSNAAVAAPQADGTIKLLSAGSAAITAKLGATNAAGTLSIKSALAPTGAAPAPTRPAADVISLFGAAYPPVTVDTWSAAWDVADVADVSVGGKTVKKYTNLSYAGVEFISKPINASSMTLLHLDLWTQSDSVFRVKLVDFGANGVFGGGDDSEHEVSITKTSTPGLVTGAWNSLDIPLAAFAGLKSTGKLAQMILTGSSGTIYLDNVYFYKAPVPTAPTTAAPTPTRAASSVISLFSSAYTNVRVDTWRTDWSAADFAEYTVAGRAIKKYSNLVFAGIETTSQQINASSMTGIHLDLWTPSATTAPKAFKIKLVDFGANGAFGGGDDVEHELSITAASTTPLATGSWVSLDLPFTLFTGLTTRAHLAQYIISGDIPTVFLDNVYFYGGSGGGTTPTAPTTSAPTPTWAAGNVISLFSNAYTNVPVDTWSAGWDQADVADVKIGTDDVKKYSNLVFAGIEFTSQQINASTMTHFHMDIWTPNTVSGTTAYKVKLVDFGANGAYGGGDDVEHEISVTASSSTPLKSGSWVSLEIPLSQFTGLITKGHLAQMIISGDLSTVFVDNVLLHK